MNRTRTTEHCRFFSLAVSASAILIVAAGINAHAAEWRIEPQLRVGAEFDDNAILDFRTDTQDEISGFVAEGLARFVYTSPVTDFFVTPRLVHRDYGEPDFDSDDQFLAFSFARAWQSSNFTIRGNYGRELVRTAERSNVDFNVDNPDEIPEDDTGRVFLRDNRERIEIVPQFTYRMSNVSTFGVDVGYMDVSYDEGLLGLLNDYTNIRGNLSYRRSWSRRNTAIVTGTYRQYEAEGREAVSGYGVSAGFENRLSEKTIFRALVGVENTELDTGEDDVNPVANISLTRRLETITLIAQYRRVIAGGGGGSLTARDMININFTRRLSDRISAGLGVRAYTTTALEEGAFTIDERDYLQLRARFVWDLSKTLALEADYRYTILDRELIGESANSNNIILALRWRPTPFIRSQ